MDNVIISPEAKQETNRITDYIADKFDNYEAAERARRSIIKGCEFIGDNPYAGRQIRIAGFKARRWVVRKKYLIYYEISEIGRVIILRVTDAQQDQKKLLT
jgi:plasmid stabilization system protein ParE